MADKIRRIIIQIVIIMNTYLVKKSQSINHNDFDIHFSGSISISKNKVTNSIPMINATLSTYRYFQTIAFSRDL